MAEKLHMILNCVNLSVLPLRLRGEKNQGVLSHEVIFWCIWQRRRNSEMLSTNSDQAFTKYLTLEWLRGAREFLLRNEQQALTLYGMVLQQTTLMAHTTFIYILIKYTFKSLMTNLGPFKFGVGVSLTFHLGWSWIAQYRLLP